MRVNVPAGTMARAGVQQVFFYVFETRRAHRRTHVGFRRHDARLNYSFSSMRAPRSRIMACAPCAKPASNQGSVTSSRT
jgi:hypothetical protein